MHESVDESAINEAKEDSAVNQDFEPATSEVVHGCSSKSDEKVQDDPQRRSLRAATVRFHAENPASDGLRDANGLVRSCKPASRKSRREQLRSIRPVEYRGMVGGFCTKERRSHHLG